MERETCLSMLIVLIGGVALLACGWWPAGDLRGSRAARLERAAWRGVWRPIAPAFLIAASFCGWALTEPDPMPEKAPFALIVMSVPFALLFARAAFRAAWSVIGACDDPAVATVGMLRPWIVFSPHLAKQLGDRQIEAVLEHERAHARHRDPLRILLAQFVTDLQWPWPQAGERLSRWLIALELARDEDARAAGIEGADLADAIIASARFSQQSNRSVCAALTGEALALKDRIARLLEPLPAGPERIRANPAGVLMATIASFLSAIALGMTFGEGVVRALFRVTA